MWVAGYTGSPADGLIAHWDGTAWTTETLPGAGELCAIAVHGDEVWAAGRTDGVWDADPTAVYRRSAAGTWTASQPLPAGAVRALAVHGDELWAAGDHGAVLHRP